MKRSFSLIAMLNGLGYTVRFRNLSQPGQGFVVAGKRVVVNGTGDPELRLLALAHETAHILLDQFEPEGVLHSRLTVDEEFVEHGAWALIYAGATL